MQTSRVRGFSLIELLIVAAVSSLFFGGLFVAIQSSLKLVIDSRARTSALSVANDQIEYIRSLAYDAVGTVSGIPNGAIPQVSTTTLNGIVFTKRTLIEYVDDPADGVGAADSNGITTDYKQVKIEVSWSLYNTPDSAFLVSNIVPRSIETDVGGGTIRVNVFDATVAPVSGATVRLINTTGTSSIDVTRMTDGSGIALFGGAPANSGYQVMVTKTGYSSDQTWTATGTLANPTSQPFAVVEADVATVNFFIDELANVSLRLLTDYVAASTTINFASTTDLVQSTSTTIATDTLVLQNTLGVYDGVGTATLVPVIPGPLARWDYIAVTHTTPVGSEWRMRLYSGSSADTLIPDSILPGNSGGFTESIDISQLDSVAYPSLYIGFTLTTSNTAVTPQIDAVQVYYRESETPLSNTPITLQGSKTIGTDSALAPVYKNVFSTTTDASGERELLNIEWDAYTWDLVTYDIAEQCTPYPIQAEPGASMVVEYLLVPDSAHSLRVTVVDGAGVPVRDATVRLERGGNVEKNTQHCGQTFFDGLVSAVDYRVEVSAPGYAPVTVDPVSVNGDTVLSVTL